MWNADGKYPPHAYLWLSDQNPSREPPATKFLLTKRAPDRPVEIDPLPGNAPVPFDYAWLIIRWAKDYDENGINNWQSLWNEWTNLEENFMKLGRSQLDEYRSSGDRLDEVAYNMLNEMAVAWHPRDKGGMYPMWIRVEYTNGEHNPPHAHLYSPSQKPSPKSLITKFLITKDPPRAIEHIKIMRGKPSVPSNYAQMIIRWVKDCDEDGLNNWAGLKRDWRSLEKTFRK